MAVGSRGWRLWNEQTAPNAIVEAISGAKHVVNAEFFGLTDAGKGRQITDALVAAATRGVEVNVIVDMSSWLSLPIGSFPSFRHRLADAGATLKVSTRLPWGEVERLPGLRHVDHRKVVTVDATTGFVGGQNFLPITDGYHDSMLQLTGVDAARLAAEEADRWERVGGSVTPTQRDSVQQALDGASLVSTDPLDMRIVKNAPDQGTLDLSDTYLQLIRGAKRRLWISSPAYSDRTIIDEVRQAAARGVDVRVVAPGGAIIGVPLINWIGRSQLKQLDLAGGKAFEIPEVLHRKALISDDTAVLSSYNITGRSREHDHEIGIRTKDPEFVQALAGVLATDMARGKPIVPAEMTGIGDRIGDWLAQKLHVTY